jgi:uncharacterized protein YjbJ (UPF0337 family)
MAEPIGPFRRIDVNEDRMVGSARNVVGKAEHGLGDVVGSDKLKGYGLVDQATGSIQHGYGVVKDAVPSAIDDAPGAVAGAVDCGRELGRRGDEVVRERLGDNGPLYLLGGVVALFAIGAYALTRSSPAKASKPVSKRRGAKSHN